MMELTDLSWIDLQILDAWANYDDSPEEERKAPPSKLSDIAITKLAPRRCECCGAPLTTGYDNSRYICEYCSTVYYETCIRQG